MARVIYDTFTESSDTALGSHTPDERPGSESWTVASGTLTVTASLDQLTCDATGTHRGGINRAINGDWDIYADLENMSGTTGDVAYPAMHAFLSTSYDDGEALYFQYSVNDQRYVLGYISTTDGESFDLFSASTPTGGATLRMERAGNTINGYVDGVLRCTLSVAGTTDFATPATFYPGLSSSTTSSVRPYWDNFEVYQDYFIAAGTKAFTLTAHAATVSVSGDVNVSAATKSYTLTTNAATVNAGVSVSANTKTYTLTTHDASVAAGGAALTVDASVVNVVRHSVRYEPRTPDTVRNFRGSCLSAIVTARGYRRVWDFETPLMDTTTAASFEADISTGDLFTLTGYLVGGATVTAAVVDIQRTDSPLYSSFTFTAEESL